MIDLIAGTRPEIIKLAPVIHQLERLNVDYRLILSGQHYDYEMLEVFIENFNLENLVTMPPADEGDVAHRFAEIILRLTHYVTSEKVVVQGDTDTALAGALVARKRHKILYHVEAGLRSYDWRQPEEHNRKMIDRISDVLFAPTNLAKINLLRSYHQKVYVTGNTIIDAIKMVESKLKPVNVPKDFVYLTLHRAETVDDRKSLNDVLSSLEKIDEQLVWPLHPRTKKRIEEFELTIPENVILIKPVDYLESLWLLKNCKFLMTDSGGLVEEATYFRKFTLILRRFNDRPEACHAGFAVLTHLDPGLIVYNARTASKRVIPSQPCPYGDGKAAERIVRHILFG